MTGTGTMQARAAARLKIAQVATIDLSVRFLLLDQLQALQQAGHDVVAICAPGKWVAELRSMGVQVETVEMARELHPVQDLRSLGALARCFREHRFDVVHTHTPKAGLIGPIAARLAGVPVVVHTIHGLLFHDQMPRSRRLLYWMPEKLTATFSNRLLSQSREDVEVAVRSGICRAEKISFIGNGIDIDRFSPEHIERADLSEFGIGSGDVVVGSVGRLVYDKGFAELFAAAEELVARHKNLKFLVVGPEEKDQNDAIDPGRLRALQQVGAVRFTGWLNDTPRLYSRMDLFVLPSYREGIPRACMEAAAMGVPVIATDIRGCREVVRHGETGLLVPVRNARALAEAIEALVIDSARRRQMGVCGRRYIRENFSNRLVLDRELDFYEEIAAGLQAKRS